MIAVEVGFTVIFVWTLMTFTLGVWAVNGFVWLVDRTVQKRSENGP